MLKKTKVVIKNEQSKSMDNIGYTRHRTNKQTKQKTQRRKLKRQATYKRSRMEIAVFITFATHVC